MSPKNLKHCVDFEMSTKTLDNCAEFGHALQMVKHSETPILDQFFFIKANGKNKAWRQNERQEIHIEGDLNLEFLTDDSLL